MLTALLVLVFLPAVATAQSDEEAVRAVVEGMVATFNAGDADASAAHYADDAVQMPPQQPARVGKEAIVAALSEFVSQSTVVSEAEIVDVEVHGDLAHVRATYHDTATANESGEVTQVSGNWLLVLARGDDGAWKVSRELWAALP